MNNINNKILGGILVSVNIIIIAGIILFLGGFFSDYSVGQKEKSHLIGASYMTMNNEYFRIISEAINARVEAEGDQIVVRDPALDVNRQIDQINEMINMGTDLLVINPVDWNSLTPILKKAKNRGIKIIVVDSNISEENLIESTITSDNYQAGQIVGEYFLSENSSANLVLMTHESAISGRDRIQGFLDTVSKNPNIKIVERIECEGQTEIAMPRLKEFINSGNSFDTVFCLNDLASVGVVAALDDNDLLNQVKVYGIDASPDSKALIYEGMMRASAAQFPIEIGNKAGDIIYKILNGEEVEKNIKIPVKLIHRGNVVEFGIDRWQ